METTNAARNAQTGATRDPRSVRGAGILKASQSFSWGTGAKLKRRKCLKKKTTKCHTFFLLFLFPASFFLSVSSHSVLISISQSLCLFLSVSRCLPHTHSPSLSPQIQFVWVLNVLDSTHPACACEHDCVCVRARVRVFASLTHHSMNIKA